MRYLILLLTLISGMAFSQNKIGLTFKKVKSDWSGSKFEYTTGYFNNSIKFIQVKNDRASLVYLFDKTDICDVVIVIPTDTNNLNFYLDEYNNRYQKVTDDIWSSDNLIINLINPGDTPSIEIPITIDSSYFIFR